LHEPRRKLRPALSNRCDRRAYLHQTLRDPIEPTVNVATKLLASRSSLGREPWKLAKSTLSRDLLVRTYHNELRRTVPCGGKFQYAPIGVSRKYQSHIADPSSQAGWHSEWIDITCSPGSRGHDAASISILITTSVLSFYRISCLHLPEHAPVLILITILLYKPSRFTNYINLARPALPIRFPRR
jgi:hypothetical protein